MPVEIYMPKMSDHMEAGEIIEWLVGEGDHVEERQEIVEIMTDKVIAEIEAPATGTLKGIRSGVEKGATIPVGETIAFITQVGEEAPVLPPLEPSKEQMPEKKALDKERAQQERKSSVKVEATPVATKLAQEYEIDLTDVKASGPVGKIQKEDILGYKESKHEIKAIPGRVKASPAARRLARELGIDIQLVTGTGPDKLISEKDIIAYSQASVTVQAEKIEWLELTQIQKLTGERMLLSATTVPQFSLTVNADMEKVLWIREALMERVESESGRCLSITTLLVKIVATALREYPRANSSFENGRIKLYKEVNVGVAVGSPDGLVVPVITKADQKSLGQINGDIKSFEDKSKNMRFSDDDLSGGHFTISNLGMYDIDHFNAIVNPPQSSILAVGRIIKTPVGIPDNTITLRPMMNLTLSVDHRCLDGVQGAQFLSLIKRLIEKPYFFINGGIDAT